MTAGQLLDLALRAGPLWLAIFAVGVLSWALLYPRKDAKGNRRSPLIVPGTEHDRSIEECRVSEERTRRFYESQLAELRKQSDIRVGEVRGYRDEALATNAHLLETLTSATRDIALVLQILEMASRNGSQSEPADAPAKD